MSVSTPDAEGSDLRILIVDFLDSYTHNLPGFIRESLGQRNKVEFSIQEFNSLTAADVDRICNTFHGIVLSPGPGTVDCADDLGTFVPALLAARSSVPIFGVCLGFQAICHAFCGSIRRLRMPHHGLLAELLDTDLKPLRRHGTRYHSLEVVLPDNSNSDLQVQAVARNYDDKRALCIMEVEHRILPIWGVQYHPESVYSHACHSTIQPFLNACRRRMSALTFAKPNGLHAPELKSPNGVQHQDNVVQVFWEVCETKVDLARLATDPELSGQFVILDSSSKGDWDIFAGAGSAHLFQYCASTKVLSFRSLDSNFASTDEELLENVSLDAAWDYLRRVSNRTKYREGPPDVPFWGGFVGYLTYELGLNQLGLRGYQASKQEQQDIQLIWSTETVVYQKKTKMAYLISLRQDNAWIKNIKHQLKAQHVSTAEADIKERPYFKIEHPSRQSYLGCIEVAQEEIRAGNSYELCLTAPSIARPLPVSKDMRSRTNGTLFNALRKHNPAAYMSYTELPGVSFISASPEEFLSFDADTYVARMRPMKGTVNKQNDAGRYISFDAAKEALHSSKVIAENLMIVDLVRNDLSKVSRNVTCPSLFEVEEIEGMYQLTSTVQAQVDEQYDAWDLLKHTLPPGSMTGAPKRRSCEILQKLERKPRGLYSGVVGYVDVRGHCKMSVSIRNACKLQAESHWTIAAGGAITAMSDPEDEWKERQLKAQSICRVLEPDFEVLETIGWDPKAQKLVHWNHHYRRLLTTLDRFGFDVPLHVGLKWLRNHKDKKPGNLAHSRMLREWIKQQLSTKQLACSLRLSLQVTLHGRLSLRSQVIEHASKQQVEVRLDPCALNTDELEPFISYKTTKREHYTSARTRAGVEGRDEVILFRPNRPVQNNSAVVKAAPDDLLTEGSYTNVAVLDEVRSIWITPSKGCLPGITREHLLQSREVETGDIQRHVLRPGMRVRLFNSVRGIFEGVISTEI